MGKILNFYCDESTHLEKDSHPYMILSFVSTEYHQLKLHNESIRNIKRKHFIKGEMKWSKISKSQYECYKDIVNYFFASDLSFRAIVIDKSKLKHSLYNQTHAEFYDKMYFQLLIHKLSSENSYNIYMDIKDSYSFIKAKNLKKYLERDYEDNIRILQQIRSYESELMQLTDILIGAVNYKLRGLNKVTAKNNIIKIIEENCPNPINMHTSREEEKFNLFHINLR